MANLVEQRITLKIAEEIGARREQVIAAVALLDEGATVPFISRYRKEVTGGLDDIQLRLLDVPVCNAPGAFGQATKQHKQQFIITQHRPGANALQQMCPTVQLQAPVQRLPQQSAEHGPRNTGNEKACSGSNQSPWPQHVSGRP